MAQQLIQIEEIGHARGRGPRTGGLALWELGFRPFYLLASLQAALSVALWALQFAGWLPLPYLPTPLWHAHEMVFGFALAVIVGFLFTAGHNWTGLPTPRGPALAALALLWLAARVLALGPWLWASALANAAFPLAAALALAKPLLRARSRRNYFFVVLLCALATATVAMHLARAGWLALPEWASLRLALDLLLFILAVMAGRVVPMFTNNGVRGAAAVRQPMIERLALGAVLALLAADATGLDGRPLAIVATLGAALHLARWLLWQPWKTLRTPLVWVLHLGYAWIPLHLALRALAAAGWLAPSLATHALTVGALGGLVIGMMTRTAKGHTGRPLIAGRLDVACYLLVTAAALARVLLPLIDPGWTLAAVLAAAGLWSAGFGLYAVGYGPALLRPRLDGRPG